VLRKRKESAPSCNVKEILSGEKALSIDFIWFCFHPMRFVLFCFVLFFILGKTMMSVGKNESTPLLFFKSI
jgi:hypothetical protein